MDLQFFLALQKHGNFGILGSYSGGNVNNLVYTIDGLVGGFEFSLAKASGGGFLFLGIGYCIPVNKVFDFYIAVGPAVSGFTYTNPFDDRYTANFYGVGLDLGNRINLSQHLFINLGIGCMYSIQSEETVIEVGFPDKTAKNEVQGYLLNSHVGIGISWGRRKSE